MKIDKKKINLILDELETEITLQKMLHFRELTKIYNKYAEKFDNEKLISYNIEKL